MSKRDTALAVAAAAVLLAAAFFIYRSVSGGVGDAELESIFDKMPTEELVHRRATLAALLESSPATEPKSDFRLKYEQGLADLDAMLKARGVDPTTIDTTKVVLQSDR